MSKLNLLFFKLQKNVEKIGEKIDKNRQFDVLFIGFVGKL